MRLFSMLGLVALLAVPLAGCKDKRCTEENCAAMVACNVRLSGEPDYVACAEVTPDPPATFEEIDRIGYCQVACQMEKAGEPLECLGENVDRCSTTPLAVHSDCVKGYVYSEACGVACEQDLIVCENACPTASFQSCIDCSGTCRADFARCRRRCKVNDLNTNN